MDAVNIESSDEHLDRGYFSLVPAGVLIANNAAAVDAFYGDRKPREFNKLQVSNTYGYVTAVTPKGAIPVHATISLCGGNSFLPHAHRFMIRKPRFCYFYYPLRMLHN